MKPNPVVHFEMPASDKARVVKFYEEAFGWKMQIAGEEYGGYVMAQTSDTDENGMVKTPGTINGGFFPKADKPGFQMPSVVIAVEDINTSMEMVKKAGGKILGEPMDIPGIGKYVAIEDSEGNRVGTLQPNPRG